MSRDITLRSHLAAVVGDETYELWLRHLTDAWALALSGAIAPDGGGHQDFLLPSLIEGDEYTAQLRLIRAGRYRSGYLSADPGTWPSASRSVFTPGELVGAGAPTVNTAVWVRTSNVATKITVNVSPLYLNQDLTIFRDGVAVGTIAQPHTGPVNYVDNNPPAGLHAYTAKHSSGLLYGAVSNTVNRWAGPDAPTGFVQTGSTTQYYAYDVDWDAGGNPVRIQDDYLCSGTFATKSTTSASTQHVTDQKDSAMSENGNAHITFAARIRAEVVLFGVTDVSDWVTIAVLVDIAPDETAHNSCP